MKSIEAIIYDVDGTLLDTREWILSAFENSIKNFNFPHKTRDEISKFIGQSLESCYENLAPRGDVETMIKSHKDFQHQRMELVRPFPNLIKLLESQKHLKQGLVSSRVGDLEWSLQKVEIADYFDCVIGAKDVENKKPHPEPVLKALEALKASPEATVSIGDGAADIEASKAAGIRVLIGITHGFGSENDLVRAGANRIVHNLAELKDLLLELETAAD